MSGIGRLALPAAAQAADATLSGRIFYKEPIRLPADASVEVRLVDVARADAPATIIAERVFPAERRNPIPFVIPYDAARIAPGRTYALQARILSGGRLLFTTTQRHLVLGAGAGGTEIRVDRVATAPGETAEPQPASPAGFWRAEDIKGGGVLDRVESRLDIFPDGRIGGSAGCNLIAGRATISAGRIAIGPLRTTRMACPPGVNAQEQRFLAALAEVRGWRVDIARRKLFLLAADGAPVLQFSAL
ncbi:YbaY family lipoprotein [Xanthobacter sp. KR7-225]|uniref:YbaY family lipoprotein n=1 Tax=Xanthobacter sp. KR7-225 TaxID=3156613 RepID=UPI0032B4D2C2